MTEKNSKDTETKELATSSEVPSFTTEEQLFSYYSSKFLLSSGISAPLYGYMFVLWPLGGDDYLMDAYHHFRDAAVFRHCGLHFQVERKLGGRANCNFHFQCFIVTDRKLPFMYQLFRDTLSMAFRGIIFKVIPHEDFLSAYKYCLKPYSRHLTREQVEIRYSLTPNFVPRKLLQKKDQVKK